MVLYDYISTAKQNKDVSRHADNERISPRGRRTSHISPHGWRKTYLTWRMKNIVSTRADKERCISALLRSVSGQYTERYDVLHPHDEIRVYDLVPLSRRYIVASYEDLHFSNLRRRLTFQSVRNVLREHARSMPLRATCSEELSVALQRRWDGAMRRAEERSGLRTACRLPLYPSPTTCERERRRSLSPVPTVDRYGRYTFSCVPKMKSESQ